jgi:hypothetical protein
VNERPHTSGFLAARYCSAKAAKVNRSQRADMVDVSVDGDGTAVPDGALALIVRAEQAEQPGQKGVVQCWRDVPGRHVTASHRHSVGATAVTRAVTSLIACSRGVPG